MEFIFKFSLVIFLVLLNGYFVASEFALVAVRKTRIDELVKRGNRSAKLVQKALKDIDSFISATQLGITIASLALGWIGEPALARFLEPYLSFLPRGIAGISSHSISIIIAFSIITFLHIVLGELAPKTIALQRAEATSLFIIAPLNFLTKFFWPFIWILNGTGGMVLRLFGFKPPSGHQLVHSEEEIKMILDQSVEGGVIEKEEVDMVNSVFRFGDIPVRRIMVPRGEIIAFDASMSFEEMLKDVQAHTHSRFPIYENSIDTMIGFIHIKDIYKAVLNSSGAGKKLFETKLIREIIKVQGTKRIDDVLLEMRRRQVHIAAVSDASGKTLGIVMLENIVESLVGKIEDEFD